MVDKNIVVRYKIPNSSIDREDDIFDDVCNNNEIIAGFEHTSLDLSDGIITFYGKFTGNPIVFPETIESQIFDEDLNIHIIVLTIILD